MHCLLPLRDVLDFNQEVQATASETHCRDLADFQVDEENGVREAQEVEGGAFCDHCPPDQGACYASCFHVLSDHPKLRGAVD